MKPTLSFLMAPVSAMVGLFGTIVLPPVASANRGQVGNLQIQRVRDYWPLAQGNSWEFSARKTKSDPTYVHMLAVTGLDSRGASNYATLTSENYRLEVKPPATIVRHAVPVELPVPIILRKEANVVSRVSDSLGAYEPPLPMIQPTLAEGQKWKWTGIVRKGNNVWSASANFSVTLQKPDPSIPISALKKYPNATAVHMRLYINFGKYLKEFDQTYWYVPDIGPVAFVDTAGVSHDLVRYKCK